MQGKVQLGGMRVMFGTWMRQVAFGVAFLKRPKKLVNDALHFFCTLSAQINTVHFNYVPSVLEL